FEDQVENKPQEIAVISNDVSYNYSYINNRANQLARFLRQKGLDQETRIGIVVERSVEMIIAIFAVLKSGAAYVPIDPEYPKRRMEHILEDCNPQFVLTESKYVGEIPFVGEIIDLKQENLYVGDTSNLEVTGKPNNLAYILYTSGSTGRPKGVMIEHCSIVNFLFSMSHLYPMDESDTYLLKTPYIFDVSVLELFGWTIVGSKLVIMENGEHRNPRAILRTIDKYDVKLLNFVPSMFRAFVNTLNNE
ncbi:AMP-binding protein, partial [Bacillus thuringiensis]|nr:AMP-binding protein [Bacillus thuringiensis]